MANMNTHTESSNNNDKKNNVSRRTQSFGASYVGNLHLPSHYDTNTSFTTLSTTTTSNQIHTLILGTHPSITSLSKEEYFGHAQNALWWITGDCLGFCRAMPKSPKTQKPYKFASELRYTHHVLSYPQQLETLTNHGFAIWDLIQSCERKGSLDVDIQKETPNLIQEFCTEFPTIQRIVFANGLKQCQLFTKHFSSWWEDDSMETPLLVPAKDDLSKKAFGKRYSQRLENDPKDQEERRIIECVCMVGVSPANARLTYKEKRDYWEQHCFTPGLLDQERFNPIK